MEEPTPKELTPEEKPEQARRAIIERIGVYQPQIRHSEPEVRPVENPLAPVAARHKTYMEFLLRLIAEAVKNGATKSLFMDGDIKLSPPKSFNLVQASEEVVGPLMMTSIKGDVTAELDFSLMVSQSCKNQELAWEFIKFCIEEAQNPGRRPATAEECAKEMDERAYIYMNE